MKIIVLTNRKHHWLLPGFCYLFNRYWSQDQDVTIATYGTVEQKLPENFSFLSIDDENYPAQRWTDGLIRLIERIEEDHFILMLEDYYLIRSVRIDLVNKFYGFIETANGITSSPHILRVDLTSDRASKPHELYAKIRDGEIQAQLIQSRIHAHYLMSFQAGIWNRVLLAEVLRPGESPWQAEIRGTQRLRRRDDLIVLGSLDQPVKYQPIWRSQKKKLQINKLPAIDAAILRAQGWLK